MQVGAKNSKLATRSNKISRIWRGSWWKDLLMTFIATTFSIVLTFGTAALIDKRQKEKSKRQMVMYVLYDMSRSIDLIESCDSMLRKGFELQLEVARDTSLFETKKFVFYNFIPQGEFDKTTAQIFSSNFETLNTLDNVRFVEMISTFYRDRDSYESVVIDSCQNNYMLMSTHWDLQTVLKFPFSYHILMSSLVGESMRKDFQQCKELMGVSDEELAAYIFEKESQGDTDASAENQKVKLLKEMVENEMRLEAAIEEGKSGEGQSE
jgi:hypothetical protein